VAVELTLFYLTTVIQDPYHTKSACSLFHTASMTLAEPMKITIK
jgi:hypothetical protein